MLNRAQIIDENFNNAIKNDQLPAAKSTTTPNDANLNSQDLIDLFDSQLISRHLDLQARKLKEQNLSYYTIGSSGHEGSAVGGLIFRYTDMAFLHYRDCAFMVQRSKQIKSSEVIKDILLSYVASKEDPIAAGRHKVLGSVPLTIPPQTSTIASHLPKALGTALSITRAKELNINSQLPSDSVVLCSFGDASTNHASAQATFNACQWIGYDHYPLPLVFICEDNGTGISVPTPKNWIEDAFQDRPVIKYLQADGLNLADLYQQTQRAEQYAREQKKPVFLHIKCVRLLGHAGSDIETQYLIPAQIEKNEADDPLLHSARILLENQIMDKKTLLKQYQQVAAKVEKTAQQVIKRPKLTSSDEVMASLLPKVKQRQQPKFPSETQRKKIFAEQCSQLILPRNLCQQINFALTDILLQYDNVVVFGEDVAKKGGVYRVTAGLTKRFGQRRVFNTLLDETTILGTAIGLAHNGFIPIPEIQFLAYLHNAEDQLRGEAATLSFFSSQQYTNSMVIRIAGLAYQKGFGGHFHNDNSLAVLRDIPGVIIACPSNGPDAAKMLRSCVANAHESGRITAFIEPIALYMTKDLHQAGDNEWLFEYPNPKETIAVGEIGVYGQSKELVILTYGNGYYLSRQAAKILQDQYQTTIKIIDLRWLAPLNEPAIIKEVKNCRNVLIVDECRKTGSISEALTTLLVENLETLPKIKRITGEDTFIPLGQAWQYVLPSCDDIINAAIKMLGLKQTRTTTNCHPAA